MRFSNLVSVGTWAALSFGSRAVFAQTCNTNADCPGSYSCDVAGTYPCGAGGAQAGVLPASAGAGGGLGGASSGGASGSSGCETIDVRQCVAVDCASDADCGPGWSCDKTNEPTCMPPWQAEAPQCSVANVCGTGFDCVQNCCGSTVAGGASAGGAVGSASSGYGGQYIAVGGAVGDGCACQGTSFCLQHAISCVTSADCPAFFDCYGSAASGSAGAGGSGLGSCVAEYFPTRYAGGSGGFGGAPSGSGSSGASSHAGASDGSAGAITGSAGANSGIGAAVGGALGVSVAGVAGGRSASGSTPVGETPTPQADDSGSNNSGCQLSAGGPIGLNAFGALLPAALIVFLRRRKNR
jgi:hypothetical protein